MQALGLIETRSLTGAIDATDAMTKTADVKLIGTVKIGSGLVNVIVTGQVAAVRAAGIDDIISGSTTATTGISLTSTQTNLRFFSTSVIT